MRNAFLFITAISLSACGDSNPNAISMDFKGGAISGSYSPEGWTSDEVRASVVRQCPTKKVTSYAETPKSNGWIDFVAICEKTA